MTNMDQTNSFMLNKLFLSSPKKLRYLMPEPITGEHRRIVFVSVKFSRKRAPRCTWEYKRFIGRRCMGKIRGEEAV